MLVSAYLKRHKLAQSDETSQASEKEIERRKDCGLAKLTELELGLAVARGSSCLP